MGRDTAAEVPEAIVGETLPWSANFIGKLDAEELLASIVDIEEENTSDLTITNKTVNTSTLVILGETALAGQAVQFTVSGFLVAGSPYSIKITATTDAEPTTPVKIGRVTCTVVS